MSQYVTGEVRQLVHFFKAMADDKRLRIISLLAEREYNVGDLATALEISEPTTSHHLKKLRSLGLLNLRADGNSRYYRLNPYMLDRMKSLVNRVETLDFERVDDENDLSWLEDLTWLSSAERAMLERFTFNGRLVQVPSKLKHQKVIIRWLASLFETDREYSEREVNAIIQQVHEDYATWRRELINFKYLTRDSRGQVYRLIEHSEPAK